MSRERYKIAVLASGNGSTFESFVEATQEGVVDIDVVIVITNKPNAGILDKVKKFNEAYGLSIETAVINGKTHPGGKQDRGQTLEESAAICAKCRELHVDLVVLMGYLRIVAPSGDLMREYGYSSQCGHAHMINTHPGILPDTADTYGLYAQERVIEKRLKETAHTVHMVASKVDGGPIIAEHKVPIYYSDTPERLFKRVQRIEKAYLPIDISDFLHKAFNTN